MPPIWPQVLQLVAFVWCLGAGVAFYMDDSYWLMWLDIGCALVNVGGFLWVRRSRQKLRKLMRWRLPD